MTIDKEIEFCESMIKEADEMHNHLRPKSTKWTEELVLAVIVEARKAGWVAAQQKLQELQDNGLKYVIQENGITVSMLLDVCGMASLKISAKGKFYQLAKKLSDRLIHRFHCCPAHGGGGSLSIFDSTHRQEMSVNIAACQGQQRILETYGIKTTIASRID